jgi:hypothetical protein
MTGAVGLWCDLTRIAEHLLNVVNADTSEAEVAEETPNGIGLGLAASANTTASGI